MRWLCVLLAGCGWRPLPEDQVCAEVGYAIAARTRDCAEDEDLALARWEAFEAGYDCLPVAEEDAARLLDCAASIRELECADVDAFGDDLARWLEVSPACPLVVEVAP